MEAINKHRPAFRLAQPAPAGYVVPTGAFLYANPGVPASLPDRQCALLRFHALMQRLDRWLQAPLRITRDARGHTVWLMQAVGYRVDRKEKAVYPVIRGSGVRRGAFTVDVANFLRKPAWLEFIVRAEGLSDGGAQGHLFSTAKAIRAEEAWLCDAALDCLNGDARFQRLRRHRLPEALGLDASLVRIACAARALPAGGNLSSEEFTWAWRHETTLRTAARENPQLLPLVAAAMREGVIPTIEDAVEPLRWLFAERGLKPATWRFAARHGVRWLRPVWEASPAGALTAATIDSLRVFEEAGLPAPPPPEVMQDWADWADVRLTSEAPGNWGSVPAAVLAACCEGARLSPLDDLRREEIALALEWGSAEQPRLDKRQRRAGWAWVRRRSLTWERRWRLSQIEGPASWPAPLPSYSASGFRARAIAGIEDLVDTGLAFRNCIADFAGECQRGTLHLFVIGEAGGRDVAVAALTVFVAARQWVLMDLKGPCNGSVTVEVGQFAAGLVEAFNRRRVG